MSARNEYIDRIVSDQWCNVLIVRASQKFRSHPEADSIAYVRTSTHILVGWKPPLNWTSQTICHHPMLNDARACTINGLVRCWQF